MATKMIEPDTKTDAEAWRESIAGRCKAIEERLLDFAEQANRKPPEGVRLAVEDVVLFATDGKIEHPPEHAPLLWHAHHIACELLVSMCRDPSRWAPNFMGYVESSRFTAAVRFCEGLELLSGPQEPPKPRAPLESLAQLEKLNNITDRMIIKIAWNVDESDPEVFSETMEKLQKVRAGKTDLWPKYGAGWVESEQEKPPHLGIMQFVADEIRKERAADEAIEHKADFVRTDDEATSDSVGVGEPKAAAVS